MMPVALKQSTARRILQLLAEAGVVGVGDFGTIGEQRDIIIEVYDWDDDYHEGSGFIVEYDWDLGSWKYYEGEMVVRDMNDQDLTVGQRYLAKFNGDARCMTNEPVATICQKVVECDDDGNESEPFWLKLVGRRFNTEEECEGYTD